MRQVPGRPGGGQAVWCGAGRPETRAAETHIQRTWPLREKARHFELGALLSCAAIDAVVPAEPGLLGVSHAGCWECDLADDSLFWSGGVYDIFGLPRGVTCARSDALAFYAEHSRASMERLRGYAIRHRRGFTLDAEILPATGGRRWMRLIAMPIGEGDRPVRLQGLKLII